jgi:hypothetical protein
MVVVKEPLKLMPLADLKKVVAKIADLPKDAVKGVMPKPERKKEKR